MKLITREDIERWGESYASKGNLPTFLAKLVRATTSINTKCDFPSGTEVFVGGWDAIVKCKDESAYVPAGTSLWEFGTTGDIVSKANEDYNKRTNNPLGWIPHDSSYVFVTTRYWRDKEQWVNERQSEGKWKEVRAYDSSDLEQWLELAPAVTRWFAHHVGRVPYDGADTAEEFWQFWSCFDGINLDPQTITAGREKEQEQILAFLQGPPRIMSVKAATKEESIAFIIAAAQLFSKEEKERFFSKTMVVNKEGSYKSLSANFHSPLNLIPKFDNRLPLYSAVSNNHHVIVPLGADDEFNQNTITLPTIARDGQIEGLITSGLHRDDAERYSREAGRNITILKRLLNFPINKSKWIGQENLREIIPALLLGRWNESFPGDIQLIEHFSGLKYSDYVGILHKWSNFEDSPIIQIGETWRLLSPLDSWAHLSPNITPTDLENLSNSFSIGFKDGNPFIEPGNSVPSYFTKKRKFSDWSREGLTQSLILIARFGKATRIPGLHDPQLWVDKLIFDLLHNASGEKWISLNHELPLISEASPNIFLTAVHSSLQDEQPEIMDMFIEEQHLFDTNSNYTGLLWALEGLAWLPEFLEDAALILLILSRLDPGGRLTNRPINSLTEIFKPWHYQTLATYEQRIDILTTLATREPSVAWNLLMRLLPKDHAVAHPTHKMRWRIFDKNTNLSYTYEETYRTHSDVISLLLQTFDYTESKFAQLISESPNFQFHDMDKVLIWAQRIYEKVPTISDLTWSAIRKILHHHRSHSDAKWALSEHELNKYEDLYIKLQPTTSVRRYLWLFDEQWPAFPEGIPYEKGKFENRHKLFQERLAKERQNAALTFIKELGLNDALELRKLMKAAYAFGDALAIIVIDRNEIIFICNCLNDETKYLGFIHAFIFRKSKQNGIDWIIRLFFELKETGFNDSALVNLIVPLEQSEKVWSFISTLDDNLQALYWRSIIPNFYRVSNEEMVFGIGMLIKFKRFLSAMEMASHYSETIPTHLLVSLLSSAVTQPSDEAASFKAYEVERIFEELDKRSDVDPASLINLEWLYLPILASYGTSRNPNRLENELSVNPEFFVEVLKWVYRSENDEKSEDAIGPNSKTAIENKAILAFQLLNSWKKIPGLQADYSIDELFLFEWINKARALAQSVGRIEVADMQIGQLLAQYPEDIPQWPQETIFKIIEHINTDSLKRNYSSGMFNKRGSSVRGAFDGGNIERTHAEYFETLADRTRSKYPNVSEIFRHLSQDYLTSAVRMDEEAERNKLEY